MSKKRLYIIGNGFDLHHGIQSSYCNFKNYIKQIDGYLFELVETYLSPYEDWSDLEESLAKLDVDYLTDKASSFLVSYGDDNWSDSYHHDYQYEIEQIVESLSTKLKENFTNWIKQLTIPSQSEVTEKQLDLDSNAKYLNFNYTNSLGKIYSIKKSNILFIHGSINRKQSDLILGHAWNPSAIEPMSEYDYERLDTRVIDGIEIINQYFRKTFKPTSKLIKDNIDFFSNLQIVSEIYVLGHSLSDVDMKYFKIIVENTNSTKVQWVVSFYNKDEKEKHKQTMNKLGINQNIRFIQLNDLEKDGDN